LQCDLDVACAEFDRVVEVPEFATVPYLDRAAVPALMLADPHAFRIVAVGPERRSSGGADPFRAALMPGALFLQPLLQRLQQLVEATQRLDQLLFLIGKM